MNPDQAIDRVLSALATTEASPEMEQRLLNTLQTHAAAQHRTPSTSTPLLPFKSRHPERSEGPRDSSRHPYLSNLSATYFRPWAIAAGLIILSLAASLAVRRRHEPMHTDAALNQHTSPETAPAPQIAEAPPAHRAVLSASRPRPDAAAPEDINDLDALATIEMNAPSRPAPPLPLTHQEKLLAEAVHQNNPTDLSSLRPEVRDRQMELSKAEFHEFFEPQPAKDNE